MLCGCLFSSLYLIECVFLFLSHFFPCVCVESTFSYTMALIMRYIDSMQRYMDSYGGKYLCILFKDQLFIFQSVRIHVRTCSPFGNL